MEYYQGNFESAIETYKYGLKFDIEKEKFLANIGCILEEKGNLKEAVKMYEEAYKISPFNFGIANLLAWAYRNINDVEKAITLFNKILEKNQNFSAKLGLSYCYLDIEDEENAIKEFEDMLKSKERCSQVYLELGKIFEKREDIKSAISYYKKSLNYDLSLYFLHRKIGELNEKIHELENAYKEYAIATLIEPNNKSLQDKYSNLINKIPEYVEEIKRKSITSFTQKIPPTVTPVVGENIPLLKIGIVINTKEVILKCGSEFIIKKNKVPLAKLNREIIKIKYENGYIKIFANEKLIIKTKKDILLIPKDKSSTFTVFNVIFGEGTFFASKQSKSYRGMLEVQIEKNSFNLINILNVEEYLYGMLPGEISSNFPYEAIKAHAILARTYAISRKGTHGKFDLCSEVHCAAYKGVEGESKLINKAVDETFGYILTKDDKPAHVVFHSTCGGYTRNANDVWKGKFKDTLISVSDVENPNLYLPLADLDTFLKEFIPSYCYDNDLISYSNFRWIRKYNINEINELLLNKVIKGSKIKKIQIGKRLPQGPVDKIILFSDEEIKEIQGEEIRKIFGGLRSTFFKLLIKYNKNDEIEECIFFGAGWGHGVGLCQTGAKGMAKRGANYIDILTHYFPNTKIKKIY
jgi:SpoIID/LytB domain protein